MLTLPVPPGSLVLPPPNRRGHSLEDMHDEAVRSTPMAPATVLEGQSALLSHSPRQRGTGWQASPIDFASPAALSDRLRTNNRFRTGSFDSDRDHAEHGSTWIDHRPSQAVPPALHEVAARSPGIFRSSYSPVELTGQSPSTARSMAYHSARSPPEAPGSVDPARLSPGLSRPPSEANAEDDVCFPRSPPGLLDADLRDTERSAADVTVQYGAGARNPGQTELQELPPGYPYTFDLEALDGFVRSQREQPDAIPISGRLVTGLSKNGDAAASGVSKSQPAPSDAKNNPSFYARRPRKYTPQEEEAVAAHVAPRFSHAPPASAPVEPSSMAGRYQRKLALFEDQTGTAPPPPPTEQWDEELNTVSNADGVAPTEQASHVQATAHSSLLDHKESRARQTYGVREDEDQPEAPSSPRGPVAFLRRKSGRNSISGRGRVGAEARYTPAGEKQKPFRFAFYSNALNSTIHARQLYELPAPGQTFEDLLKGRPASSKSDPETLAEMPEGDTDTLGGSAKHGSLGTNPALSRDPHPTGAQSARAQRGNGAKTPTARAPSGPATACGPRFPKEHMSKTLPGGRIMTDAPDDDTNTWWLDIQSPTVEEMKVISKAFGIHPLTTEDILMEETREKIELFRNYYLVCFRSFDQDPYSPTYLQPLNMYIIVFREGTLSFHFRSTPHPHNVRRRIKQLKDYIQVTSDWISYALIDDITDAFGPLIQSIEYEVDSIDELVLILKEAEQSDMLRRIGTCRKKVMGLLRLMGSKADVVKGLAKRCNENWSVAPKSDIGLYLSDIQDHLITMTQNLNHYEKILSRSHSNYLAQISIEMTDANNQINDVLSKLTALGTVIVPLNIVTGLWGMNVKVPGQVDEHDNLYWFGGIVAVMVAIGLGGFVLTLRFLRR